MCAGDVMVWDVVQTRLTRLDDQLELAGTLSFPQLDGRRPLRVTCVDDTLVVAFDEPFTQRQLGPYTPTRALFAFDLEGNLITRVARIAGDDRYRRKTSDGIQVHGRRSVVAGAPYGLVVGEAQSPQVYLLTLEGDVVTSWTVPGGAEPVSDFELRFQQERELDATQRFGPSVVSELRKNQESYEYPEFFPPYDRLLISNESDVWIRDYRKPSEDYETWSVFGLEQAEPRRRVRLPLRFRLHAVRGAELVGVWRNELDEEFVRIYSLR